jgi:hypothetical protein
MFVFSVSSLVYQSLFKVAFGVNRCAHSLLTHYILELMMFEDGHLFSPSFCGDFFHPVPVHALLVLGLLGVGS